MDTLKGRAAKTMAVLAWAVALAAALLSCAPFQANAATSSSTLNPNATGSITVTLTSTDGNPVGGGQLSLYKVADVTADDTGWHFKWLDAYSGVDDSLYGQTGELSRAYSSALAQKLDGLVSDPQATAAVDSSGTAKFGNVGVGLYLVKQTETASGYDAIDSFVVSVPVVGSNGSLVYDVDASPKAGQVTPTPSPENPGNPEEPSNSETPSATEEPSAATLPQTGQLWWPVAVLGAAGIVLVCAGLMRRRGEFKGPQGGAGGSALTNAAGHVGPRAGD